MRQNKLALLASTGASVPNINFKIQTKILRDHLGLFNSTGLYPDLGL